ncbi:MAG: RNA polymerase sigma factor [Phycisphaerae bacterium]
MSSELDDRELVAAHAAREAGAFGELVARHARWVFAAAYRQLGDVQTAEDATQIVFVLLHRRAGVMVIVVKGPWVGYEDSPFATGEDRAAMLRHFSEQSGLTWSEETRTVRHLFIEKAAGKRGTNG